MTPRLKDSNHWVKERAKDAFEELEEIGK